MHVNAAHGITACGDFYEPRSVASSLQHSYLPRAPRSGGHPSYSTCTYLRYTNDFIANFTRIRKATNRRESHHTLASWTLPYSGVIDM